MLIGTVVTRMVNDHVATRPFIDSRYFLLNKHGYDSGKQ